MSDVQQHQGGDDEGCYWIFDDDDDDLNYLNVNGETEEDVHEVVLVTKTTKVPPLDRISQLTMSMMGTTSDRKRNYIPTTPATEGLRHLLERVDYLTASNQAQRRLLKGLILEARPSKSKWVRKHHPLFGRPIQIKWDRRSYTMVWSEFGRN